MGVVVSAWHTGLEQRVAIKLLLSHMRLSDGSALERFQREARAAARIQSEHVCRVLDTGHLEDGTPFLVMEYLEGCDLSDELLRRGRFEVTEAVRYVREACVALMHAHQAGVIHRDLKPANLFLVQRQDGARLVKVLDFGVSKSISSTGIPNLTLTKTSAMVGSPIYMSPEQLNSSKDVDGRTDIWALGIILYELMAGRTPFYGESIAQLVNAVLNTEPESLSAAGVDVPPGLEQVVRRALAKSRDQRYGSAKELYNALAPFSDDRPGSISGMQSQRPPVPTRSMSGSEVPPRPAGVGAAATPPQTTAPETGSGRTRTALIALLLIALAGVAAVFSRRNRDEPQSADTGSAPSGPSAPPASVEPPLPPPSTAAATATDTLPEGPSQPSAAEPVDAGTGALPEQPSLSAPSVPSAPSSDPRRPRERARPRDVTPPAAAPKPESSDEYLPNFGGRR